MKLTLKKSIDKMVNNYLITKNKLRYDGNLINHFAALIFTNSNREPNYEKIREIRKYIKEKTSWFSAFRGNNLYIMSILLSLEESWKIRFQRILKWEEELKDQGFIESPYLSVGIWILTDNYSDEDMKTVCKRMRQFFALIKKEYYNVTSSDDYIVCAILVALNLDSNTYLDIIDNSYDRITELDITSNNGAQTLSNILCTAPDNWEENLEKAIEICESVKSTVGSLQPQYLGVIGIASTIINNANSFGEEVSNVEKYLKDIPEYEFFMDRGFRLMLSMFMVIINKEELKVKHLNSIIALTINYSLMSQQQALISGVN